MKFTTLIACVALSLVVCDKEDVDNPDDTNADTNDQSDMADGGTLKWYSTCGDPVCSGYGGPWDGVPACGQGQQDGLACQTAGESCDFMSDCNAQLLCTDSDPKQQPGGCPISRPEFKDDIDYIDADERAAYYRSLLELELATYRYKQRSDRKLQLGIILDDDAKGVWVDDANDRVDLYGYTSLAVAGVQVQAEELAALRSELAALREELAALKTSCAPR